MGQCYGKVAVTEDSKPEEKEASYARQDSRQGAASPYSVKSHSSPFPPASPLPKFANSPFRNFGTSPATPRRFFRRPFPPPSPAKHIQAALAKRHGTAKPKEGSIPEGSDVEKPLDKNFVYGKNFTSKYELGHEIGHGHFGHTCLAKVRKGEMKGQSVAVKIIAKAKMTTAISVEDVRREVKILKALSGHQNLVRFYDACEDNLNVYIVMELCEGGELLDRILSRGGKYTEEDAKVVIVQILSIVSFCHLQGVVHRDLKPENFLFTTKDENATLKAIDFGLSDFIKPEERLNDIVGSAYYVAPEVLHRSYSTEADVWSVGVIAYILLCGSRPFWADTESGIFRAVIQAEPNFVDKPWPTVSPEAQDFVKQLLHKDMRKRMSAAQALTHPWIRGNHKVPLDMLVYRLVKAYLRASSLKRAALKALSKTLTEDHMYYLRCQFALLEPNKGGRVSFENFKTALMRSATEAMKESRAFEILSSMDALAFKKMDFQEFCAAAISVHQLEASSGWETLSRTAYDTFDREGNRLVIIEEVAREVGLGQTVPAHLVLRDWIRSDGKLSLIGFKKLLHGVTSRARSRLQ
ncbi:CDPK-related protein kinase 3 [Selaginella moellendorffii]|uniref:CDPK-related protein kinase 3 n=1 Tax=Selaginella moellendorffii TaxID=88036 RepID=D8RX05_SELML|nr:CDPK-related kinase 5 isoform X1 [Selaginella moellendorffii]EFJ23174.1 CDPK-related protein kinase 3 [Selaginella moellendorffii]|eukprot:XP_002975545.1 CDPK-related kinase 5 isoform X1 [Selaginella moellendorffii]